MESNFSLKKIFTFSGAIVAYLIGSGFASGQEAMQFLTSFGLWGCLGAVIFTLVIYVFFSSTIMEDGHKLKLNNSNKIFTYYCGKHLGLFFEWYTPVFLFLVFIVMISGAGATLFEYYGLEPLIGRVIMAVLSLLTVLLGLDSLVNIVSKIGPAIILFVVIIGIANIVMNPAGILHADQILETITVKKAAPTWYISGIIFPSMGCVMITPFLASLGSKATSKKEAKLGGILGGFTFAAAVAVISFGLMASIGELYSKDIPSLFIADKMFPAVGTIFSFILFGGIYTTAVPMLWLSCNRIYTDEKSKNFKILAVILTIIAFIGSRFKFATLVNIFYPISGYLGVLLLLCIVKKQLIKLKKERYNTNPLIVDLQE